MAWRIIMSSKVRELVELGRQEAAQGRLSAFKSALDYLQQRLSHDPLTLGDFYRRLKHLGLNKCHAIRRPLIVHFAVDEQRRWVYCRSFSLYP